MHSYARPSGSKSERQFIRRYIACLPGASRDRFGNWHVTIESRSDRIQIDRTRNGSKLNRSNPTPIVLFSSHTDTVHRTGGRQHVVVTTGRDRRARGTTGRPQVASGSDESRPMLRLARRERQSCLGADDTAGIWIMREMILAGVPGRYVFHHAEEIGCVGSNAIATRAPELLDGVQAAIAFDRGGCGDVITHQHGRRCASDACATWISEQLAAQNPSLVYEPEHGVFTDTAEYAAMVPECTNLSVGYSHAHSPAETLDLLHLIALRDAVVAIDWSAITIARDPSAIESRSSDLWPDIEWDTPEPDRAYSDRSDGRACWGDALDRFRFDKWLRDELRRR